MKFFTTLFLMAFFIISAFSQTNRTFTGETSSSWSDPSNWMDGEIADDNTENAFLGADAEVDGPYTVNRLDVSGGTGVDRTMSGSDTLRIDVNNDDGDGIAIRNNSNNGVTMSIEGLIVIENTGGSSASSIQTRDNENNQIVFAEGSILKLNTNTKSKNFGSSITQFNGVITGEGTLTFISNNSHPVFGETADNSNFEGIMVVNETEVISNSTVMGGFASNRLRYNNNAGMVRVNGVNSLEANITKNGTTPATLEINANQSAVGDITLTAGGVLNLNINDDVTTLHFANTSTRTWSEGAMLNITGFKNGVIRFGVADTSLTAAQLEMVNIGGATPMLDANGFLTDGDTSSNSAPNVINALNDRVEGEGFGSLDIALTDVFADPDGDALSYTASSSDEGVATVSVTDDMLTITEVSVGISTITVIATDTEGNTNSDEFTFTVEGENAAPTVLAPMEDRTEDEGFGSLDIALTAVFTDPDGDALTYTASSSDENIATVSISDDMLTVTEVSFGETTITVTATDEAGNTVSDDFIFTIQTINSTTKLNPIEGLTVFPNPVTNEAITLTYDEVIKEGQVSVVDVLGSVLQTQTINNQSITILNLAKENTGMYFIIVEDMEKGKRSMLKILK